MRPWMAVVLLQVGCGEGDAPGRAGGDPRGIATETGGEREEDTDEADPVLEECRVASSSGVRLSDGRVLFVYTYLYDDRGLLTEVLRDHVPIDEVADAVTTFTYDAQGRKLTDELDEGDDGSVDVRKSWTYGAAGPPLQLDIDRDADGAIESTHTYTYGSDGVLTTETFRSTLPVADWKDDLQYDQSRLVRRRRDTRIDGSVDEVTDYAYGEDGVAIEEATKNPDDESALRTVTRTTDGSGHVLTLLFEDFADGSALRITYTYDALGNVSTAERDPGADGTPTTLTTYVWDCS